MKRKRKILSTVIVMLMLGSIISGCSEKEKQENKEGDSDKVKLTIMHTATEESVNQGSTAAIAMKKAIENFRDKYPDVELAEEIVGHDAGYETKVKTLAAANELPDLFEALPSMMSSFYDNGQILDLAPTLEKEKEWTESLADGMFGDFVFGDTVLGSPQSSIVNHVVYYNKEIFKKCGIETFPADAEEFKEAVKILKDNGYIPVAAGNKGKYVIASQIMPGILMKYNSQEWYEDLKNYKGASFEDKGALDAIKYLKELMDLGMFNEDLNSLEPLQARQLYFNGKAAMCIEGSWALTNIISEAPQEIVDNTELTIFPPVKGKEELEEQLVGGQGWGISVKSGLSEAQQEAAINFLKEMTGPEIQTIMVEGGVLPTAKEVEYDESKVHPLYKKFLDMYHSYDKIVGCPEVQLSTTYMDASYVGYQEMSIGALTPEELAAKLQEAHESAKK